jgi:hypothetical protein
VVSILPCNHFFLHLILKKTPENYSKKFKDHDAIGIYLLLIIINNNSNFPGSPSFIWRAKKKKKKIKILTVINLFIALSPGKEISII